MPARRRGRRRAPRRGEARAVELACAVALAGQPALWTRALGLGAEAAELAELGAALAQAQPPRADAPPFPRHRLPGRDALFIGRGFRCEARHSQRLEDLKSRDLSEVAEHPPEQGDPRIFGVGGAEARATFLAESQFNQMVGILGATGVGKTRYAEALLVQVIRLGMPLIVIDPKGDQVLTNRVVEECRRAGRAHQLRYFSLAAPRDRASWAFLARYNPCSTYTDPAELAARVASVLPSTKDPFWTNVAKAMAETCLSLCHWCHEYLRLIGRGADGALPPRGSRRVPDLLAAMQWARHHPAATAPEAGAAVALIRARLTDPAWMPEDEAAREVVSLLTTTSLMGAPVYSPLEWVPTIRHVAEYMIDHTIPFLAWMLKIVHAHAYLDHERFGAPDIPRLAANPEVVSKGGRYEDGSLWSISQAERVHPLEARSASAAELEPRARRWAGFYDHFAPPRPGDAELIARILGQLRAHLASLYSDATRERQKFLEYATTLQSAIKPFLGERSRIMCSVESDISWERVVAEGQVVYCALASMVDDHGASACAKLIVQDLAAHFGRAYHYQGGAQRPVWLFADEAGSFINEPFIHLLNKCRGVGLRCVIAGQTRADLVRQLGREGAQQALGNLNTMIQLRSPEAADAREFAERAGEALVVRESRSLSLTPTPAPADDLLAPQATAAASRSWSPHAVKRIPPEAVMALPRGQAFVHTQGQVFLVAQGLMPDPVTDFAQEIGMHPGVMLAAAAPTERARGVPAAFAAPTIATTITPAPPASEDAPAPAAPIAPEPPWPAWDGVEAALGADAQELAGAGAAHALAEVEAAAEGPRSAPILGTASSPRPTPRLIPRPHRADPRAMPGPTPPQRSPSWRLHPRPAGGRCAPAMPRRASRPERWRQARGRGAQP